MDSKGHYLAQPAIGGRAINGAWVVRAGKRTAVGTRAGCLGFAKGVEGLAGAVWTEPTEPRSTMPMRMLRTRRQLALVAAWLPETVI